MKKYAVIGNPIAHSKSPEIHQAFAQQFTIKLSYERLLVPLTELKTALKNFYLAGGSGVNITLPFKEEACKLVDKLSDAAQQVQAVNTITFLENGEMQGDNTDGIGLLQDLENKQIEIRNKKIAIIGAGGAARGILWSILKQLPTQVIIINRNLEKAQQLRRNYAKFDNLQVGSFTEATNQHFDVVINATSAGIKGEILKMPRDLLRGSVCYDLAYGKSATAFLTQAKEQGAIACFDGWGMLVEQAAEAFYIWHGKRPKTEGLKEDIS